MKRIVLFAVFLAGCDFGAKPCTRDGNECDRLGSFCGPNGYCIQADPIDAGDVDAGQLDAGPECTNNAQCIAGDRCIDRACVRDTDFCSSVDGIKWCWESPLPQGTTLTAVWAPRDGGFAWAVGRRGVLMRFDGEAWSNGRSGVTADLQGVSGSTASDVWAVGDGVALHFDGRKWAERNPPEGTRLFDVVTDGTVTWAVGNKSGTMCVAQWANNAWRVIELEVSGSLRAIISVESGLYAVGDNGAVFLNATGQWVAVAGLSSARAYESLVEWRGMVITANGDGVLRRIFNGSVVPLDGGVLTVLGNLSSLAIANDGGLLIGSGRHAIFEFGNTTPLSQCAEDPPCRLQQNARSIAVTAEGTIITVGDFGKIARGFPDGGWRADAHGLVFSGRSIWGATEARFAVGGTDTTSKFMIRDGGSWSPTPQTSPAIRTSVRAGALGFNRSGDELGQIFAGTDPGPVGSVGSPIHQLVSRAPSLYAVAEEGVFNVSAAIGSTPVLRNPTDAGLHSAIIFSGDGGIVVNSRGEVTMVSATASTPFPSPTPALSSFGWSITGTATNYVVAGEGLWRKDGTSGPTMMALVRSGKFGAVTGTPPLNWWAAGDDGLVLRCGETECADVSAPTTQPIRDLLVSDAGVIFVIGDDGAILRGQ